MGQHQRILLETRRPTARPEPLSARKIDIKGAAAPTSRRTGPSPSCPRAHRFQSSSTRTAGLMPWTASAACARCGPIPSVLLDSQRSYVSQALARQQATLVIHAADRSVGVEHGGKEVKRVPLQGTGQAPCAFAQFMEQLCEEARTGRRGTPRPL